MFRIISLLGFALVIGWIIKDVRSKPDDSEKIKEWFNQKPKAYIESLKIKDLITNIYALKNFIFLLTLVCFVVLAFTAFIPRIVFGQAPGGVLLMLHVAIAPLFALCIALLALMWAHQNRLFASDVQWFWRYLLRKNTSENAGPVFDVMPKIYFWLFALLAVVLMSSIVLSMFPLFGMEGQDYLLQWHRYSALLFSLVVFGQVYLMLRKQAKKTKAD